MLAYVETPFDPSVAPIVVLDTETTGLDPFGGDRIVEIGMVEISAGRRTGRVLHRYVNPQRNVPSDATKVHGLDDAFLADKPLFDAIADEVRDFTAGAIVVIQNAPFDLGFLNMEFARCGRGNLPCRIVLDTLETSRREGVAKRHTLDAMCDRYGVDRKHREKHGALTDAELLGDVFLAMVRERGPLDIVSRSPVISLLNGRGQAAQFHVERIPAVLAAGLHRVHPTAAELIEHESYMEGLRKGAGGKTVWDARA